MQNNLLSAYLDTLSTDDEALEATVTSILELWEDGDRQDAERWDGQE